MRRIIPLLLALCLAGCSPAATVTPPPADPETAWVTQAMAAMTAEDKVGQLFFVALRDRVFTHAGTPQPVTLSMEGDEAAARVLVQYRPGGVVLFEENIVTAAQVRDLNQSMQGLSRIPLFLGVDEEGGRVSRLKKLYATPIPPAATLVQQGEPGVRQATAAIAQMLTDTGFSVDFSPVADVNTNPDNPVIGDRAYSSDPALAGQMVAAAVDTLQGNGIAACIKHFPGHGDTAADSHLGSATVTHTMERLRQTELVPFSAGIAAGAAFVMAAHITAPNAAGDMPASMNKTLLTDVLRDELGFDGVIITDAMDMAAITDHYTSGEAAVAAILAGADMVLMPASLADAHAAVLAALAHGTLTQARIDRSVERILRTKYRYLVKK